MALVLKDRVKETTATTGAGTLTLAGAVAGFQSFAAIGNTNTTYYAIADPITGAWEVGLGTYTASGTTLSRDTILASSTGSILTLTSGNKDVFCAYPAEKSVNTDAAGDVNLANAALINAARIGVGTTVAPNILIRAVGDNGSLSRIAMRGYSGDANGSAIRVTKFRGTYGAPQVPQSGDSLGRFEFAAYATTSADGLAGAYWEGVTTEAWGATAHGTKALLYVTPNTTTTPVVAVTVDQNKSVSLPGSLSVTGHTTFEGVTSTGATGTGKLVYDTSPTLVTPLLGTPTSGNFSTGTFTWPTFNQSTTGAATGGASGAIAATTLSASSTVSGTGFSTYLASPPAIGGTAAAAGSFTLGTITSQVLGFQSIATAGGTTTFTATSPTYTIFTGSAAQTLVLPDATTLTVGRRFMVDNDSTGAITVRNATPTTLWIVAAGCDLYITCSSVATAAGTWELDYAAAKAATGKALTISNTLTLTGTDASSVAFGTGGTVLYSGGALGTPSSGTLTNCTFPTLNQNTSGTAAGLSTTLATSSGGTGVANNAASTITVSGNFASTFVVSGAYSYTFPGATSTLLYSGGALGTPASGTLSSCTADGTDAVGFRNIPQNAQTGNYGLVLADSGKHIYHASGAGAAAYTIPAAASVAYPIGTAISFVNLSATSITIVITTDTMYLGGTGTTGTRTLAQYGTATALKVSGLSSSGIWIITGSGLT